jgi:glycosyltransferase involved in cell wall biosynthesis
MAAATAVVMPSLYESLSIIALESWLMGTPVLVNGRCTVLKYQCRQSNGGLYYTNYAEFALSLSTLLQSASLRQTLGQQGGRYVQKTYSWDSILHKYQTILDKITR